MFVGLFSNLRMSIWAYVPNYNDQHIRQPKKVVVRRDKQTKRVFLEAHLHIPE